jgi:hypothetical protein
MLNLKEIILQVLDEDVVAGGSANFSAHSYTEIYAGASAAPVINGLSVTMAAGSSIKLKIRSISNATGCYLLGEDKNNWAEPPIFNQ